MRSRLFNPVKIAQLIQLSGRLWWKFCQKKSRRSRRFERVCYFRRLMVDKSLRNRVSLTFAPNETLKFTTREGAHMRSSTP